MAKKIKGITIEIGGNTKPLTKALEGVNKKSRDLQDELRQVDRLLKLDPGNTELLAQKQKLLSDAIGNTSDKLRTLKEAEKQVQEQFKRGEVGEEQYRAIQREVIKTEQNLQSLEKRLNETNNKWKSTADGLNKFGSKAKEIGGSFTAKVTAPIVGGAIAAVEGTREFRQELAKLENNAQQAGANIDITREALRDLGELSNDSGANVEALSNLLQAGFKDSDLNNVVNELSGAVLKFPDTLKIEGLADGLQETLATGQAIGPFAELLERMGVDLETFNEGLSKASKEGEQQNYVLKELANLGLAEVNQAYRENNKGLIENAEAQNRLKEATAELALMLEPILTTIKEVLAGVLEKFLALSPEMQKTIGIVVALAAAIGPLLMIVGQMALGLSSLIGLFGGATAAAAGTAAATTGATAATSTFGSVIAAITGPIGIAIAAIAGIIALIVTLWKTNEEFRENVMIIWEQIKEIFFLALEWIKTIINEAYIAILAFWQEYGDKIMTFTQIIWDTIANIINAVLTIIQGLLDVFIGLFTGDWERFGEGLKTIWQGIWDGIKGIVQGAWGLLKTAFGGLWNNISDWFTGLVSNAYNWGKNMISGFIDGIKSMISKVKNVITSVIDTAKSYIGFNSPAEKGPGRYITVWGENMIEGFLDGVKNAIPDLEKTMMNVIPDLNTSASNNTTTYVSSAPSITVVNKGTIVGRNGMDEFAETVGRTISRKYGLSSGGAY